MRSILLFTVVVNVGCASGARTARAPQSASVPASELAALVDLLRAHVATLDRDVILFRYEHGWDATTLEDLRARESEWSARFYDPERRGDDAGPGLFTATDPAATANWGGDDPQLVVFNLMKGARVLVGDAPDLTVEEQGRVQALANRSGCQTDEDRKTRPLRSMAEVVGTFHNAESAICRNLIVAAARSLDLHAITYAFYSTTLDACRFTGTAFNVIAPSAVRWDQANWYSRRKRLEGAPELRSFLKTLFAESRDDFRSQLHLGNRATLASYRREFGFFNDVGFAEPVVYRDWRSRYVFKCGPRWTAEARAPDATWRKIVKRRGDPDVRAALIEAAVTYNERPDLLTANVSPMFDASQVPAIEDLAFTHAGLPDTPQSRRAYAEAVAEGSPVREQKLAKLFGEAIGNYTYENFNAEIERTKGLGPAGVAPVLESLGLGRRSVRDVLVWLGIGEGWIPRFVGPPRTDSKREAGYDRTNRRLLIDVVRRCTVEYRDVRTPIEASACRVRK